MLDVYWAWVDSADDLSPAAFRAMVRVVMLSLARILDPAQPLAPEDCPSRQVGR